jgi:uncharacterized protein YegL
MKKNLTEIIFVLDRSGSMSGLENDTIGGYNAFIEKQKLEEGEAKVTCVLFDDQYKVLYDAVDLKLISPLTAVEYFPRGMTALNDAIGKTIASVGERLNLTKEEDRPEKVIMIITTDGYENSSREYKIERIKEMIDIQTNEFNWEFIFLGANIDAIMVGDSYGIGASNAYTFQANSVGVNHIYNGMSKTVASYRATGDIGDIVANIEE